MPDQFHTIESEERMNMLNPPWSISDQDQTNPVPALGDLFSMAAANFPNKIAISDGKNSFTFLQLEQGAQTLAHCLQARGVMPGCIVAILADKLAVMPLLAVAIWKCGAVYVPLDGSAPVARLEKLMHRLQPTMVIDVGDQLALVAPQQWIDREQLDTILTQPALAFETRAMTPVQAAYIIFTSGSTGEPKGVEISCASLIAYFGNHNQVLHFTSSSRVFSLSPFHFDVSIEDTILPLSLGAFVYQFRQVHAGAILRSVLIREKITHLIAVSTLLTLMTEDGRHITHKNLSHMEMVMTGAEVCDPGVINLWKSSLPQIRMINAYGPTEATIVCLTHEIARVDLGRKTSYPIGKPLRNVAIKIVGEDGEIKEVGKSGELWVGGEQVMRGYFNQPEESGRVLIEVDGVRYYRTGDICSWDSDGNVVFQERSDDEVKINGRRIHLGEIRQLALSHAGVERAAVSVVRRNNRHVIALVVMAESLQIALDVEAYLQQQLPEYMLPGVVAWSSAMSISSSGKTDEKMLINRLNDAVKLSGSKYFALSSVGVFDSVKEKSYA